MAELFESLYTSEFLLREANGYRSREQIVVDQNQTLLPGAVIGISSVGALSDTVTPKSGNTGNGVVTVASPAAGIRPGKYKLIFRDATHYQVLRPNSLGDSVEDGEGVVGTAYNGSISLTSVTAGATPWAEEDEVDITITAAAGSGNAVAWNPAATDGSQNVFGVLYQGATTVAGQTLRRTAIRRDAEVKTALLQFASGVMAAQQVVAIQQLVALGIIARA